jgi:hypothetical protein
VALLYSAHMVSLLDWLCFLPLPFLGKCSTFLDSLTSWGLYCNFCFSLIALHIPLSGPVTHRLASHPFLWKLGGRTYDSLMLAFCMPAASTAWIIPRSAASGSSSWGPETMTAAVSEFLYEWTQERTLSEIVP